MEMGELPGVGGPMACRMVHDFECRRLSAQNGIGHILHFLSFLSEEDEVG